MNYRDYLQQLIYKIINPLIRGMIKIGITPNFITVLDRYSELMTFFGICYYLSMKDYFLYALIAFVALIGSLMVSYVRARAEGLGIECKVGFMQRPERVVLTSLGALFCGVFKDITVFEPILIMIVPLAFVALFANITAFARVRHCYKAMKE